MVFRVVWVVVLVFSGVLLEDSLCIVLLCVFLDLLGIYGVMLRIFVFGIGWLVVVLLLVLLVVIVILFIFDFCFLWD